MPLNMPLDESYVTGLLSTAAKFIAPLNIGLLYTGVPVQEYNWYNNRGEIIGYLLRYPQGDSRRSLYVHDERAVFTLTPLPPEAIDRITRLGYRIYAMPSTSRD